MMMKNVFIVLMLSCFSIVCVMGQAKVPAMRTGKMNYKGDYLPVRGINVIAMATGLWREEVYEAVVKHASSLSGYINPLPSDSYHMTIHPIFTEFSLPEFFRIKHLKHWNETWDSLMNYLSPTLFQLENEVPDPVHPQYVRLNIGNGVTTLVLKLPHEEAVNMSIFRGRVRETIGKKVLDVILRDARNQEQRVVAREWFEKNFVSISNVNNADSYNYHLTLGYSRKLAERLTSEELKTLDQEKDMLDGVIRNLICPNYEKPGDNCEIVLEKPFLGWFPSMTSMHPIIFSMNGRLPSIKMFDKTYPNSSFVINSRMIIYLLLLCVICVGFYFLYKRIKHPHSRSLRSSILPISITKSGQHEA